MNVYVAHAQNNLDGSNICNIWFARSYNVSESSKMPTGDIRVEIVIIVKGDDPLSRLYT